MADTLKAMRHHRQEKAAEERVRWQGHGLDTIPLASVAEGKAHLATLDSDEAVIGDGDTLGVASERVEPLPRACQGPLGIDHPRLVIERRNAALKAWRGGKRGRVLGQPQGLSAVGEGRKALGATHDPPGMHGEPDTWGRGDPACALVG